MSFRWGLQNPPCTGPIYRSCGFTMGDLTHDPAVNYLATIAYQLNVVSTTLQGVF